MLKEKVQSLWSRSRTNGGDAPSTGGSEPAASTPDSKLFSCPQCDVVYLALEKDVCSSCRGEVREVSTTFSHG
ncbi:hypothetical protein HWV07_19540 [Natronomonas salina]|uniref:hypothetical protein n=1 Tax=Natronomonas salina TaxID=1710540 RepID=UPI0015B73FC2|nr:hypothetical protein [Natronomonas salina]QLD91119.1 hypothetical protein HWV07_19540 [Natronomonas salina]